MSAPGRSVRSPSPRPARSPAPWPAGTCSPPPSRSRSAATAWPGTRPPTTPPSPPRAPPGPPRGPVPRPPHHVQVTGPAAATSSSLASVLIGLLPLLLFAGLIFLGIRAVSRHAGGIGGGMGHLTSLTKAKARVVDAERPATRFTDVAGYAAVKTEISEVVDYLRDPGRYHRAGARGPRGVLVAGPPGTGKTLLARAVAGEARVPFFSVSGSGFVEMFVGVGAARVRDLFEQARTRGPAIVFIDEIDPLGARRDHGGLAGSDEREQTLNQLLAEMDGFEDSGGVVVLAATNRPDALDPALRPPGRFG